MEMVGTLERAVERAEQIAHPGNIVLLAPACASFDQFENYEHRGRVFKELVHKLVERAAAVVPGGVLAQRRVEAVGGRPEELEAEPVGIERDVAHRPLDAGRHLAPARDLGSADLSQRP